jgi:hypothetical protein
VYDFIKVITDWDLQCFVNCYGNGGNLEFLSCEGGETPVVLKFPTLVVAVESLSK